MPWLVAALARLGIWLFKSRIGLFLATALAWAGLSFTTISLVISPTVDALTAYASGSGGSGNEYWATAVAWMGVLNFDKALTMIIGAYVTRVTVAQGRLFLWKRGVGAP